MLFQPQLGWKVNGRQPQRLACGAQRGSGSCHPGASGVQGAQRSVAARGAPGSFSLGKIAGKSGIINDNHLWLVDLGVHFPVNLCLWMVVWWLHLHSWGYNLNKCGYIGDIWLYIPYIYIYIYHIYIYIYIHIQPLITPTAPQMDDRKEGSAGFPQNNFGWI